MSARRTSESLELAIESLDAEARGVVRLGGAPVAVAGALPGERVEARLARKRRGVREAYLEAVLEPAPGRVAPRCPHTAECGGCSLQHLEPGAQAMLKTARLVAELERTLGERPGSVLPAITASPWGYRRRARLGVRHVPGKGGVLVGFRNRHGRGVAVLERCEVLHPGVGRRLGELRRVLSALDARERIPQIEVAAGDEAVALTVRHLDPLSASDREALIAFARVSGLQLYLQPGGPGSLVPLWPEAPEPLAYALPEQDLRLEFGPLDFVQVNAEVNRRLVDRVLELLAPGPGDRVLDLYCGIGNLTLPIARRGASTVGLEGGAQAVAAARRNAVLNGVEGVRFEVADLERAETCAEWLAGGWDRLLLDPPRSGASQAVRALRPPYPERIVYVSCNPGTLARDARLLVDAHDYRLEAAGLVDMFPHTAHAEAVVLLTRPVLGRPSRIRSSRVRRSRIRPSCVKPLVC